MIKNVGIFGAGQAGVMVKKWLPVNQKLICFIDNNKCKQGTNLDGTEVLSLEDALKQRLDVIWIAVLNREASVSIESQIHDVGFDGEVIQIQSFRERQDVRLAALRLMIEEIKRREIPGEMAELGVYKGELAKEMNRLLPKKRLYLFDTFEGFDKKDIVIEKEMGSVRAAERDFSDTSMEEVRAKLPYAEQAVFCKGYFPESLSEAGILPKFALVSLDPDLYEPVYQGLRIFYPLLSTGGMILIHDYNSMQFPGVKKAVDRYCREENLYVMPLMDLHGSCVLLKQGCV